MTLLSVNLNKVALLRNSRGQNVPDLLTMAKRAVDAGAGGVTIHPRPDQRHAKYSDVESLAKWVSGLDGIELNIEGYPSETFLSVIEQHGPHQCTLVPDAENQLTSDHGWDIPKHLDFLRQTVARLKMRGIRTSLFIDHEPERALQAAETGTDRVELYTGPYAHAFGTPDQNQVLSAFVATARSAIDAQVELNAGHDLNLDNLGVLIRHIPEIKEVSIGHALTVEALDLGWEETIRRYAEILSTNAR